MKKCLALIPFSKEFNAVFHNAIQPAADSLGFHCSKVDIPYAPAAIVGHIIKRIFQDDLIIADITGSNPNVFYELGVAHTVANKTIMICEETGEKLPFDLAAYRVLFYRKPVDGVWDHVREAIKDAIREFPQWSLELSNPVLDFRPIQYAVPIFEQAKLERRIHELEQELRGLRREKLRSIAFSLPRHELLHLMKLARSEPFNYQKRATFLEELKKLESLGLIRSRHGTLADDLPERADDLKDYFELTELVREIFQELSTLISP